MEFIGSGSYGSVFKAWDKAESKVVAIKRVQIETDSDTLSYPTFLLREISVMKLLSDNPFTVKVIDVIESEEVGGSPSVLIVMEYM